MNTGKNKINSYKRHMLKKCPTCHKKHKLQTDYCSYECSNERTDSQGGQIMKHTKGKWEHSVNYMKGSDFQDKDINEGIVVVNNYVIAKIYGNNGEEIRANTNLIASAPEMLEALKLIAKSDEFAGGTSVEELQRIAKEAIAKAEGK